MAQRIGNSKANTLKGTSESDDIFGRGGNDVLKGLGENDAIKGESGNDKAYGGAGDDTMFGGGGNDKLWGDAGDDVIKAGDGNDKLWGGSGNDIMTGNKGKDTFYFLNPNSARDEITDFKVGVDKLVINLAAYGFSSVDELIDNGKSSGGDSHLMLDVNDSGNDQLQIFFHDVDNHFDLKDSIIEA